MLKQSSLQEFGVSFDPWGAFQEKFFRAHPDGGWIPVGRFPSFCFLAPTREKSEEFVRELYRRLGKTPP